MLETPAAVCKPRTSRDPSEAAPTGWVIVNCPPATCIIPPAEVTVKVTSSAGDAPPVNDVPAIVMVSPTLYPVPCVVRVTDVKPFPPELLTTVNRAPDPDPEVADCTTLLTVLLAVTPNPPPTEIDVNRPRLLICVSV